MVEWAVAGGVTVLLKRDDLIHPELPGNKYRKLRLNLDAARAQGHRRLLAFGGAYSNLIRAVAAAGTLFGFETIGVIRGEEHRPLNPSLAEAVARGMRLTYLDRGTYRRSGDPDVVAALRREFGDFYLVPEGGSNELAVRGCLDIVTEIDVPFDVICCPVGTGGTLAGIAGGLRPGQRAIGFSALKGGEFLDAEVEALQRRTFGRRVGDWSIETRYHHRGFAKSTPALEAFLDDFEGELGWRPDPIYVGKMLFGVSALAERGELPTGTTAVAVVTG
ncbi:1-aminocyclopropane-1-carboxylate deaminase/D-cysteine desulfhydrase [Cryptosporangium arvum]|uniref:1-aminocyclopropane-1-carboxylate deaminase/D-cysteine desulfhydrase n=1 Tax=Cryptosporangium arvum TaxID=80871 RepID=UPI00056655F3|nr:pyridoxal-phosphate dependent enzyme [Cryptosporangium arvum]